MHFTKTVLLQGTEFVFLFLVFELIVKTAHLLFMHAMMIFKMVINCFSQGLYLNVKCKFHILHTCVSVFINADFWKVKLCRVRINKTLFAYGFRISFRVVFFTVFCPYTKWKRIKIILGYFFSLKFKRPEIYLCTWLFSHKAKVTFLLTIHPQQCSAWILFKF